MDDHEQRLEDILAEWDLDQGMQEIANRLNIMHVNPELETEWAELRELGERYRKLEQHILDKQATFDRIKAMPAPEAE
jgi:hypothetical protein